MENDNGAFKASLFSRYTWLVETIGRNRNITFEGIDGLWMDSALNPEREHLPKKTFQNHCAKIKELFGFDILCDKKAGYGYYVDNSRELKRGDIRRWLFNSISFNNMMNEFPVLRDRVLFDRTPDGHRSILQLFRSMKLDRVVRFIYRSFRGGEPQMFKVAPYCLKIFRLEWYLLGKVMPGGRLQIFYLDRISELEITDSVFHLPANFNGDKFFSNYYGVMVAGESVVQEVLLKVMDGQQEYLRVRPLHHSQQEVERARDYSVFRYELCPAADFVQTIFSFGASAEVLAPQSLREDVENNFKVALARYRGESAQLL